MFAFSWYVLVTTLKTWVFLVSRLRWNYFWIFFRLALKQHSRSRFVCAASSAIYFENVEVLTVSQSFVDVIFSTHNLVNV